jgi:hypothetical protein
MWCERCGEQDRAAMGSDEHQAPGQWQILCEDCEREVIEAAEVEADARHYDDARWVDEMQAWRDRQEDAAYADE